jgi:hypothetical protein
VDDIYQNVNPNGRRYERLKKLSGSEVITLALFQQLMGVESQRSFLRNASRFLSHLSPYGGPRPFLLAPQDREAAEFPGAFATNRALRARG